MSHGGYSIFLAGSESVDPTPDRRYFFGHHDLSLIGMGGLGTSGSLPFRMPRIPEKDDLLKKTLNPNSVRAGWLALLLAASLGTTLTSHATDKTAQAKAAPITPTAASSASAPPKTATPAPPAPTKAGSSKSALDTGTVRKLYLDGDFEEAIKILEAALKSKGAFTHEDSVLIFKHLGVMYAANYETREKGKYYMHQLLSVEPTARIMDMYASDMIYMIFKNIQDEFESSRVKYDRAESHLIGNARTEPDNGATPKNPPANGPEPKHSHAGLYWAGATAAMVAVGATAYLYIVNQPGKTTNVDHAVSN